MDYMLDWYFREMILDDNMIQIFDDISKLGDNFFKDNHGNTEYLLWEKEYLLLKKWIELWICEFFKKSESIFFKIDKSNKPHLMNKKIPLFDAYIYEAEKKLSLKVLNYFLHG